MRHGILRRGRSCAIGVVVLAGLGVTAGAQRVSAPPEPMPQSGAAQAGAANPAPAGAPPTAGNGQSADAATTGAGSATASGTGADAKPAFDPAMAAHDIDVGRFYFNRGKYDGALARFQDALAHDGRATEAAYRAGETELKLKQVGAARGYWRQYLDADPNGKYAADARKELKRYPSPGGATGGGASGGGRAHGGA